MNNKISSALAAGAVAMSLLLGAGAANAAFVITAGDEDDIGKAILNLELNGAEYFVHFDLGAANNFYGSTAPRNFDFDNVSDAQAASDAIIAALNAHSSEITVVGGVLPSNNSDEYLIGYGDTNGDVNVVIAMYIESDWVNTGIGTRSATAEFIYADFTQTSAIPVPAAVWLFGSGLLGLVGMARRKKS